jgi:hypothetical protein
VHEHHGRNPGSFGRGDGAEQNEVGDDHVGRFRPQVRRDLLGPSRRPYGGLRFPLNDAERPRYPIPNEAAKGWRSIQRVNVGAPKRNDRRSRRTDPLEKRRTHWQSRLAYARSRRDAHLMATRDQAHHDRHDEGDVAAALKHREEDSGWLSHLLSVGLAFQPRAWITGPNARYQPRPKAVGCMPWFGAMAHSVRRSWS